MDQQGGLFADHSHDARMGVTEGVHADAGDQVEIAFAVQIENVAALTAVQDERVSAVILKQVLAFQVDDLLRGNRRAGL